LSSAKSFAAFDVNKLLRMTEFYPNNFIEVLEAALRHHVRSDPKFAKLLSDLFSKLVETNKCNTFCYGL